MTKPLKRTIDEVSRELDTHFEQEVAATDPYSMRVVKFDVHQRGSFAMIKLPFRSDTIDFGIACRSIKQAADACQVTCLFFDVRQQYESFKLDNDFELQKLGLQRIKK